MNINEALRRIQFKVGTMDDITGKAVNPIINNRHIVDELNSQMRHYANVTKGITDVYSFPLNTSVPFVDAPPLALRSESYYFIAVISRGTIFPADMRSPREAYKNFRYSPVNGITNWFMPWSLGKQQFLTVFPNNSVDAQTTTLTANIDSSDTTIPVASTNGFVSRNGRITIGSEKITYLYKDSTNFYGCERGQEQTTASTHTGDDAVTENNVIIYYARLPVPIEVHDDNIITDEVLGREIEICEEHLEGIIKAVAYNLVVKIDPERAGVYKIDSDELYRQYAVDIKKGYYRGRQGTGIRTPFPSETGYPYATNLMGY